MQSLKRQIHAVKGHGTIAVHGHNIKLGRGGIREIEFFVQTQQLIAGGRNPALRGLRTLEMLDALAEAKWISQSAADELKAAYRFMRSIEHRIQMVNDEQTHVLPQDEQAFESLARLSGFASPKDFEEKLRRTFELVQGHYSALFESAGELGTDTGSLVFTGGEDDPETIETLERMGFKRASEISATIRGWHFGRYAATRSGKSKELLTELMPQLLLALARSGEPDLAFLAFDKFIAGLPAGVQLFSMLKANPNLLDLIATILGTAPRLAEQLSARPRVLINSITAPTGEGVLFEVDMRLRPSGSQGPVATSLESFRDYQKTSAWTWEKLALTRARVVSGDAELANTISQAITASLCAERDAATTRQDVLDMRRLMVKEQGSAGLWDIKRARGGLVEIEFIAQFLQLIHAQRHPEILDTNTHAALGKLAAAGFLEAGVAGELKEACLLYHRITQVLRLCVTGAYDPAKSPAGLNQLVARAAGVPDIRAADSLVNDTQKRVAGLFDELIGPVG